MLLVITTKLLIFTGLCHSVNCYHFRLKVEKYVNFIDQMEFDPLRDCALCRKLHSN